jgi:CxxC motif-containing protein (DUF1111 family)
MKWLKVLMVAVVSIVVIAALSRRVEGQGGATEAPTGFDNGTNGLVDQNTHDADRLVFEQVDQEIDGLGPHFNGQSCAECHAVPTTGGSSTITELRAGHMQGTPKPAVFVPASALVNFGQDVIPLRSLINLKEICAQAHEELPASENIRTLRSSLNVLGDGFVEAISDQTLLAIRQSQPSGVQGQLITVPALEGGSGVGRFGWKDQHVSLLSFASDAYLNEMGISNQLAPNRNDITHLCGESVADPEDEEDIEIFTRFMRATKAPPRDEQLAATAAAQHGAQLFAQIGCSACHVPTIVTAPPGTPVAGGTFLVPEALGNKIIHPYSDFLLHDVRTGDGIVQNGPQTTRLKVRTAPLWGLRTRTRFLHDGSATALEQAILRHDNEASDAFKGYKTLSTLEKQDLITFLMSL